MSTKVTYAALGIAILALIVAVVAIAQRPQTAAAATPSNATLTAALPTVVAKFYDANVSYAGYVRVPIGWVYTDGDVLFYVNAVVTNGAVYNVYVDGVKHGNPATVPLAPGNHTVEVLAYVPGKTQIRVEYRVVS